MASHLKREVKASWEGLCRILNRKKKGRYLISFNYLIKISHIWNPSQDLDHLLNQAKLLLNHSWTNLASKIGTSSSNSSIVVLTNLILRQHISKPCLRVSDPSATWTSENSMPEKLKSKMRSSTTTITSCLESLRRSKNLRKCLYLKVHQIRIDLRLSSKVVINILLQLRETMSKSMVTMEFSPLAQLASVATHTK